MQEIWKDIEGYEGCYQVSNLGNVKSLPRKTNNQFYNGLHLKQTRFKNYSFYEKSFWK